jgi:hypothetical protein
MLPFVAGWLQRKKEIRESRQRSDGGRGDRLTAYEREKELDPYSRKGR